jgi:hypothetical protein
VFHSWSKSPLQADGLVLRNSLSNDVKIILVNFDFILHNVSVPGVKVPGNFLLMGNQFGFRAEGENVSVPAGSIVIFSRGN